MKLYNVERGSKIKVLEEYANIPPAAAGVAKNEVLRFSHLDGMYSLCYTEDGEIVHIAAWTEVEILE